MPLKYIRYYIWLMIDIFIRYWAVTSVDYIQRRTIKRIMTMIVIVWIISLFVSLGPVFGWKDDQWHHRIEVQHECLISQDVGYQVISFDLLRNFSPPMPQKWMTEPILAVKNCENLRNLSPYGPCWWGREEPPFRRWSSWKMMSDSTAFNKSSAKLNFYWIKMWILRSILSFILSNHC